MDDNVSDPFRSRPTRVQPLDRDGLADLVADYQLRLRSTDRVRVLLQNSNLRYSAPQHLVLRIRKSLVIVRS